MWAGVGQRRGVEDAPSQLLHLDNTKEPPSGGSFSQAMTGQSTTVVVERERDSSRINETIPQPIKR